LSCDEVKVNPGILSGKDVLMFNFKSFQIEYKAKPKKHTGQLQAIF